jgi:hypothetical protein
MFERIDSRDYEASIQEARKIANSRFPTAAPADLHALGRLLGVSSIQPRAMGADGYVGPLANGELVIRYREGNTDERNRFTIAHELAHIILARVQGMRIGVKRREIRSENAEERAVDRIASELLLPEASVSSLLWQRTQRGERYWDSINALRHCFAVSTSTLVLRALELPRLTAVLFRIHDFGSGFSCSCSEGRDIRFQSFPSKIAETFSRERAEAKDHRIPIFWNGEKYDLAMQGHERPLRSAQGLRREYWCVGWTMIDSDGNRKVGPQLAF